MISQRSELVQARAHVSCVSESRAVLKVRFCCGSRTADDVASAAALVCACWKKMGRSRDRRTISIDIVTL